MGQGLTQILKQDLMAIAEELKWISVDLYAAEIKAGRIARAKPERLRCCVMMWALLALKHWNEPRRALSADDGKPWISCVADGRCHGAERLLDNRPIH